MKASPRAMEIVTMSDEQGQEFSGYEGDLRYHILLESMKRIARGDEAEASARARRTLQTLGEDLDR